MTPAQYNSLLLDIVLFVILIPSVYFDLREKRIPNAITTSAIVFGLVIVFILGNADQVRGHLFGLVLGFASCYLFYLVGWMGAGDVKLISAIGLLKGVRFLISVWYYAIVIGGLIALFQIALAFFRRKKMSSIRVPYGTAICMGTFAVLCIKYGIMPFVIHNMPNIELASRVAPGLR